MYHGLVDQETLATTDFLTNPQALVRVVLDGVAGGDARVKLLGEIAAKYMQTYIDAVPPKLPLTPHHTQIIAMLIFSQFYEQREWCAEQLTLTRTLTLTLTLTLTRTRTLTLTLTLTPTLTLTLTRCAEQGLQAAILQMKTGEGKSIVIAMMAIYTVKHLGTNTDPKPKPKPKPEPEPNRNPTPLTR